MTSRDGHPAAAKVTLSYGRRSARRLRRPAVAFVAAGLLLTGAAYRWVPAWVVQARIFYNRRLCERFARPPDQPAAGRPPCLTYFLYNRSGESKTVFLHSRVSKAGHRRLVFVEAEASKSNPIGRAPAIEFVWTIDCEVIVFDTAIPAPSPRSGSTLKFSEADNLDLGLAVFSGSRGDCGSARARKFVILNGRPDDADPSHFTIGYVADGVQYTIDGFLLDDDSVTLTDRDGPASPGALDRVQGDP